MSFFDRFRKKETDVERYQRELDARRAAQATAPAASETPEPRSPQSPGSGADLLLVKDVFTITGRGTVVVGQCERPFAVGDKAAVLCSDGSRRDTTVAGIEKFRKTTDHAQPGENVGVLLQGLTKHDIAPGTRLQRR